MLRVRSRIEGLGTVVLVVAAICTIGAVLAVRHHTNLLFDAFRDRSTAYVQAFAMSLDPWLDPIDLDMLRAASSLMMAGSALFIRIEMNGQPVFEQPRGATAGLAPEVSEAFVLTTAAWSTLPDGASFLDVVAPIPGATGGYVRIGIDRGAVAAQARNAVLLAAGAGLLFVVLVLGAAVWGTRRTQSRQIDGDSVPRAERLTAGTLEVDLGAKVVTLNGEPVPMTPKQFRLLSLLAEQADRVCSEQEILDGVWPDSPYADGKDVKQYIYLIRRRLAAIDPGARARIETVPGFGYRLVSNPVDPAMTKD